MSEKQQEADPMATWRDLLCNSYKKDPSYVTSLFADLVATTSMMGFVPLDDLRAHARRGHNDTLPESECITLLHAAAMLGMIEAEADDHEDGGTWWSYSVEERNIRPIIVEGVAPWLARNMLPIPAETLKMAKAHAKIQAGVRAEPPGVAVCHDGHRFRLFDADAWTEPKERSLLPWSPPSCSPIAIVKSDGSVTPVGGAS